VLSRDANGRRSVVVELDPFGGVLGSVGIDGRDLRRWAADQAGRRLVAGPTWADGAAELPVGWVAVGPEGRFPLGGPVDAVLRRVPDGHSVPFGEVPR
jgi:hypothetical protein